MIFKLFGLKQNQAIVLIIECFEKYLNFMIN